MRLYFFPIAPNPTRVRLDIAKKRAAALQFTRFRELDFIADHAAIQRWDERYRARDEIAGIMPL